MTNWDHISNVFSAATSQIFGNCTKVKKNPHNFTLNGMVTEKRIYLVTWNVHGSKPPADLTDLLSLEATPLPEMYAIGLQEVGNEDEWETAILSHLRVHDYVRVKSRRLLGIVIMLFVNRSHLHFVTSIESEVTRTGFKGYWGNKGAASIRLDFMGMNLIFVNSHLAPHIEAIRERIVNIDNIIDGQKFRDDDTDNIMDHDYVFWMGDLNFRMENMSYNRTLDLIHNKDYKTLAESDQLRLVMEEGLVFEGFHEGELNFPPTYKFDSGTDNYDTSSQKRIPSYTDRILYYYHDTEYGQVRLSAKNLQYSCHSTYKNSDHKPVSALISINVISRGHVSPVTFEMHETLWRKNMNNDVVYTVRKNFPVSVWDWIGIYKADFVDFDDHVTYIWAAVNSSSSTSSSSSIKMVVRFTKSHLSPLQDGEYVLCYFNKKNSLCGISKTFLIRS